jgi:hypothetical protein
MWHVVRRCWRRTMEHCALKGMIPASVMLVRTLQLMPQPIQYCLPLLLGQCCCSTLALGCLPAGCVHIHISF